MLLTTCPNCAAQFKVQPEQLNVRQGRVMCGRCRNVFNAFETLHRTAGEEAGIVVDAEGSGGTPAEGDETILTDEQDNAPVDLAAGSPETSAEQPGVPLPTDDEPPLTDPPADVTPGYRDGEQVYLSENNSLLLASSQIPPHVAAPSGLWKYLIVLAVVAGLVQAVYFFRNEFVQAYPQLRPHFSAACEIAGCRLSWGRDDSAIKIGLSDLVEPPGKPGRILLTATLVNRSRSRLDLPAIEVRLTDNADQVLLSRILFPADYLGRAPGKEESLAAGAELFISLGLEVTNKVPASGYTLRPFYP
jgi:predicted Zn finger-like uncharacterized protein